MSLSAITKNTPKRTLFGAGTIHKGLVYNAETSSWNFEETLVGATNGGSKLTITPELYKIPYDDASVNVKGLTKKVGETATLEINFAELTNTLIKSAVVGTDGTSEDEKFDVIVSKESIVEGDYWDNIAFVGETADGEQIIVILENALCTSGFGTDAKAKTEGVATLTFECYADIDAVNHKTLPYKIYLPKEA